MTKGGRPKIDQRPRSLPSVHLRGPPGRSRGFVCIVDNTLRVHYAGVAGAGRGVTTKWTKGWGTVRGVNRKRATCGKWKWTKYRCKHSTVRVSIYDAPSSISSIDPPFATTKAHGRTRDHDSTVRLSFILRPPPPSFHPVHTPHTPSLTPSATDVRLENSPVARIHQVSTKYRKALFSAAQFSRFLYVQRVHVRKIALREAFTGDRGGFALSEFR